jgi:hypothetical protein
MMASVTVTKVTQIVEELKRIILQIEAKDIR